jgi:regulator of cell morphogenesis and NO signaling
MSEVLTATTVGEIVAGDFRRAAVFEEFGIDFCCSGRRTLADACRAAGADERAVTRALDALPTPANDDETAHLSVPELLDHIVFVHHAYVRAALPRIAQHLTKLVDVHGSRHPELKRVAMYFAQVGDDLTQHMFKEERILFPYVRDLAEHAGSCGVAASPFGSVENPIRMMEREHAEAGAALRLIRELTGGYTPPADGCTTYQVTMAELRDFERDLHRHVHLENNVLFPAAVRLEEGSGVPLR